MAQIPDEIALPHFEDRLAEELDRLHRQRLASGSASASGSAFAPGPALPDRHHRPWARPRRLLVAGIAVLAVAAGAVAFDAARGGSDRGQDPADRSPSGQASPDGSGGGGGGGAPEVRLSPEELVARVREATAAIPEDAIIHETNPIRESPDDLTIEIEDDGSFAEIDPETGEKLPPDEGEAPEEDRLLGYTHRWYDRVTGASRTLITDRDGDPIAESGWPEPPGVDEGPAPGVVIPETPEVGECDPTSGLEIDENGHIHSCDPPQPAPEQATHTARMVDHCRQQYADMVGPVVPHPGFGYIELFLGLGDLVIDGTEEVDGRELLRVRNHDGSSEMLVDPETYLPLRTTLIGDTTEYEYLPRTAENLELLSPEVDGGYDEVPAADIQARVHGYWDNPTCR